MKKKYTIPLVLFIAFALLALALTLLYYVARENSTDYQRSNQIIATRDARWTAQAEYEKESTPTPVQSLLPTPIGDQACSVLQQSILKHDDFSFGTNQIELSKGEIGRAVGEGGKARIRFCAGGEHDPVFNRLVYLGDCLYTTGEEYLQVNLNDNDRRNDIAPTKIRLGSKTALCFNNMRISYVNYPKMNLVIELIQGSIRVNTDGWGNDGSVEVITDNCTVKFRGTDAVFSFDPLANSTAAYVLQGQLDITDPDTEEKKTLYDGKSITYEDGSFGPIYRTDLAQWAHLEPQPDLIYDAPSGPDQFTKITYAIEVLMSLCMVGGCVVGVAAVPVIILIVIVRAAGKKIKMDQDGGEDLPVE